MESFISLQTYGGPLVREKKISKSVLWARYWSLSTTIIFIFFIGLPIWFKTTQVYRAKLPHAEISDLSFQKIEFPVKILIILTRNPDPDTVSANQLNLYSRHFFQKFLSSERNNNSKIVNKYAIQIRYLENNERKTTLRMENLSLLQWNERAEQIIPTESGTHVFWVLSATADPLLTDYDSSKSHLFVGSGRHSFVYESNADASKAFEQKQWNNLVADFITSMMTSSSLGDFQEGTAPQLQDSSREFPRQSSYQILISLLNADVNRILKWDVENQVHHKLEPFLNLLSSVALFKVSSQIIHHAQLPFDLSSHPIHGHVIPQDNLRNFIHPSWNLVTPSNHDVCFHFAIYVPKLQEMPVCLLLSNGNISSSNSFTFPQWGGVYIYEDRNRETIMHHKKTQHGITNASSSSPDDPVFWVDLDDAIRVLVSQMKFLFGIKNITHTVQSPLQIHYLPNVFRQAPVTLWEVDFLMRRSIEEMLSSSIDSLLSLSRLLSKIKNMVIVDELALEVFSAVEKIQESKMALQKFDYKNAILAAQSAKDTSERAFFDPTVLEMLYFPEENKFAVYVPLFVPIIVPVLAGLYREVRKAFAKGNSLSQEVL